MAFLLVVCPVAGPLRAELRAGGWGEKKGRRLSPAALPEEALFNVLSPSTHLSQAAGAAKPIIPVQVGGGVFGLGDVHEASMYPRHRGLSTGIFEVFVPAAT
jgi:hypothetical protein